MGKIASKFDGAEHNAIGLSAALRGVAEEVESDYFDAGGVTTTSKSDAVHLDADQHRDLGIAIAARVVPIFEHTSQESA